MNIEALIQREERLEVSPYFLANPYTNFGNPFRVIDLKACGKFSPMRVRAHVFISGRVQGVFFRESTKNNAEKLGVSGWVRNLSDGRVEAVFEGKERDVKRMLEWCRTGPKLAKVEKVEIIWEAPKGEKGFEIKYLQE